jgi:hypothetical protein
VSTDPQCIYYMSLVVQAQADNIPDSPLHSALNQLVASVQARLMQHRGGASSSSDAGGCLAALYSAELCGICGDKVVFQPHSEDSVAAEGSALGGGGSVLHGSCAGCGVRAERCCYSLRLVTTTTFSPAHSNAGGVEGRLITCPVCDAVTGAALVGSLAGVGDSGHSADSVAGSALLCPYCGILMHPL